MDKIKIVKDGITRTISEKDAAKWGERGYKRAEAVTKPKPKAKANG